MFSPKENDAPVSFSVELGFTFRLLGDPTRKPTDAFEFQAPNRVIVTGQPACASHIPCNEFEREMAEVERDEARAKHRAARKKWSRLSGLSADAVNEIWKQVSHHHWEADPTIGIDFIDARTLASRGHVLAVVYRSSGDCLDLAVFSIRGGAPELIWKTNMTPAGDFFCKHGFQGEFPRAYATKDGLIEVLTPEGGEPHQLVPLRIPLEWLDLRTE